MLLSAILALAAAPPQHLDAHGDPLPPGAVARLGSARFRNPTHKPFAVAASPDGKTIVAMCEERIRIFDAEGRALRDIPLPSRSAARSAISPDGRLAALPGGRVAGAKERYSLRVVDLATGATVRTLNRARQPDGPPAFSPDGKYLASSDERGVIRVDEVAGGKLVASETVSVIRPRLVFSNDGRAVAVAGEGPGWYLWEWATGKPSPKPRAIHRNGVPSVAPGGGSVAYISKDKGSVVALGIVPGAETETTLLLPGQPPAPFRALALRHSPDGRYLAVSAAFGVIHLYDAKTHRFVRSMSSDPSALAMAFNPDGSSLIGHDGDGVRRWDVATGKEIGPGGPFRAPIRVVALSGDAALTSSGDAPMPPRLGLWDVGAQSVRLALPNEKVVPEFLFVFRKIMEGRQVAAFSADGTKVAYAGREARPGELVPVVRLIDARTGKLVGAYDMPEALVLPWSVAFSSDGKLVHCLGDGWHVHTRSVADGKVVFDAPLPFDGKLAPEEAPAMPKPGTSCGFAPGGRFAYIERNNACYVYETASGKQVAKVTFAETESRRLALSPDGRALVVSRDGWGKPTRRVIDTKADKPIHSSQADRMMTGCGPACFAADGGWVATTGYDAANSRVSVGDSLTHRFLIDIDVPGRVASIAASSDGTRLIVGLEDSTALVYPVPHTKDRR